MEASVLGRIRALQKMTVAELRQEWERVFGEPPSSQNRQHLLKRLAWEIQARARGGLSDSAQARIEQLGQEAFDHATSRRQRAHDADPPAPQPKVTQIRDRHLSPGTVISKIYKGRELTVVVRDDGFEFDGRMFGSLTAIAKEVTGSRSINGKLFWGITQRTRRR